MPYTRSAPARTTRTTTVASTDNDGEDGVRCSGHNRKAAKRQAGPATKNAGRWFYTCPLGRDDPKKCKFFKWADEVDGEGERGGPSERPFGGRTLGGGQTLGRSPARLGGVSSLLTAGNSESSGVRPTTAGTQSPATPKKAEARTKPAAKSPPVQPSITAWLSPTRQPAPERDSSGEFSDDELDWSAIDADAIEREARTATPHTSQVAPSPASTTCPRTPTSAGARLRAAAIREAVGGGARTTTGHGSPTAFGARLRAVAIAEAKAEDAQGRDVTHVGGKRKGEDVKDTRVPKRGGGTNPFQTTTR